MLILENPLDDALLADNPNVGKTISALFVLISLFKFREGVFPNLSKRFNRSIQSPKPLKHRLTLIVCPSSATGVWKPEIRKHFPELTKLYNQTAKLIVDIAIETKSTWLSEFSEANSKDMKLTEYDDQEIENDDGEENTDGFDWKKDSYDENYYNDVEVDWNLYNLD